MHPSVDGDGSAASSASAQEGKLSDCVALTGLDPEEVDAARGPGPVLGATVPAYGALSHRGFAIEQRTNEAALRVEDSRAHEARRGDREGNGRVALRGISGEEVGDHGIAGGPARVATPVARAVAAAVVSRRGGAGAAQPGTDGRGPVEQPRAVLRIEPAVHREGIDGGGTEGLVDSLRR